MSKTRVAQIVLAAAGLVLGVLAYRVQVDNLPEPLTTPARASASVIAAWSFLLAGLVAWSRRPQNRLGPLMVITCFALLAHQFRYSHEALAFTVFFLVGELGYALYAHVALAYPSGRVTDRIERIFLVVAYTVAIAFPLAILFVYDGTRTLRYFDPSARESVLLVVERGDIADALYKTYVVAGYGFLAFLFIALIARKLLRSTTRSRRLLAPLLLAAVVAALWAGLQGILAFRRPVPEITYDLFWWQIIALTALPLALLAGLLRGRLARVHVSDLVVHLEQTPVDGLRDELAAALHDTTLELGLWLPERDEYVDAQGAPFVVEDDPSRAVTWIEHQGLPLAVLVHDPSLNEEPKLVEAVAAAARMALVNARLHAEVRAQLETVKESRARIATAADAERRRIERDLHDGAQQRLVALALELRSAQRGLGTEADPDLDRLLASTADELQVAVEELRSLAHGIHPGALTQAGLSSALEALASRVPIPVTVDATTERFPAEVEVTAYFVASEALANVVKHAGASKVAVSARRDNGTLVIEVSDDGIGGAAASDGSGLHGLADRLEAHGGRLSVESIRGLGTRIVGEIPCVS
jgi:signal transduction histidine kinase